MAVDSRVLYHNIRSLNGLIESELGSRLRARGYATVGAEHGQHRPWQSFAMHRFKHEIGDCLQRYVDRSLELGGRRRPVATEGLRHGGIAVTPLKDDAAHSLSRLELMSYADSSPKTRS